MIKELMEKVSLQCLLYSAASCLPPPLAPASSSSRVSAAASRHRAGLPGRHGGAGECDRLHGAVLRLGGHQHPHEEARYPHVPVQVSNGAREGGVAVHSGRLLLHQLPDVGVRPMEPVQLPEQPREIQGRRGEARVQPQGVPVVLHDIAHTAGEGSGRGVHEPPSENLSYVRD